MSVMLIQMKSVLSKGALRFLHFSIVCLFVCFNIAFGNIYKTIHPNTLSLTDLDLDLSSEGSFLEPLSLLL